MGQFDRCIHWWLLAVSPSGDALDPFNSSSTQFIALHLATKPQFDHRFSAGERDTLRFEQHRVVNHRATGSAHRTILKPQHDDTVRR